MYEPHPGEPSTAPAPPAVAGNPGFELARKIAEIVASPSRTELRDQLRGMAEVIAHLFGIQGTLVVALDEELPLTSGSDGMDLHQGGSELQGLFELHQRLQPNLGKTGWIDIDAATLAGAGQARHLVLPLHGTKGETASGLLLVSFPLSEPPPDSVLDILEESSVLLAAAIQSAIRTEAWNRIEALQKLAQETFKTSEQKDWDFKTVVRRLAEHFKAGAVTMLLKDQEELRLASSTDPQLGSDAPVIYQVGEGLTGHVFRTGEGLRLNNTEDEEEIRRVTGLKDRKGPRHPERDQEGGITGQFMGVPMRFGGKTVGVLRMSRREGIARFTGEDEKALQFFADLLGAALAPSWYLLLERSVLESVTEAIAVTRREASSVQRIVMANPGAEDLLGRSREALEQMQAQEIYSQDEYQRVYTVLREALAKKQKSCGPFSTQMLRPDGTSVPVTISYRFLANDLVQPPTLYTIGIARDMSQADQLAAQHKRLLDSFASLGIAYFRADQDGMTVESTELDSKITGYTPEELRATPRGMLFEDPKRRDQLLERARRNQGQVSRVAVQMRRKDGTLFWADGDLRIFQDAAGCVIGSEGFYRDVTERVRLQRFLNHDDKERLLSEDELFTRLKQDAEFHLDYLSSLGHQLQTPLNSLIQTLRNLEKGVASRRAISDRLPYVIGQAVVCTRLVHNLTYMDKILRGEPFCGEKVSMAKLTIETKRDFIHLLREKRLELIIDDESIDRVVRVQGHREMLRQVLVNLVDNAIKYSLPGTSIQIRAKHLPDGPSLEITNIGLPVPEEEREKIFQRGYRTRRAHAAVPHGTGLGLWLVRKIVEAHEATIQMHELDEGGPKRNLFRIRFPLSNSPRRTA